ncbi:hypothetical protein ACHQM5_015094 [Ranunculus cassubicifolius]
MSKTVVPEHILQPLLNSANCLTLEEALEALVTCAKTEHGRSELASKNTVPIVLELAKLLSTHCLLLSSLKLLRNLCAGQLQNQDSFIANNGVKIILMALDSVGLGSDSNIGIIRTGLQLLGNVSLAGEEHQRAIWLALFPNKFMEIAMIRSSEICDPLCMVIYTCCSGNDELFEVLCDSQGLKIMAEIVRSASIDGFKEEWLKWLLSKICSKHDHFPTLFSQLSSYDEDDEYPVFSEGQAFLLSVLSECVNQQTNEISVSNESTLFIFGILKKALGTLDFSSRPTSGLPTGILEVDILGYSMIILRDICVLYGPRSSRKEGTIDVVDYLLSSGLLELMLNILHDLGPPGLIRNSIPKGERNNTSRDDGVLKKCPYKGFRRDIVATIAHCLHKRKYAQDEIRRRDGIVLLLQQGVVDEDNPHLREWGIWSQRAMLEGNEENMRFVSELQAQEAVDAPELLGLGLRVELDPITRRPKLVNAT